MNGMIVVVLLALHGLGATPARADTVTGRIAVPARVSAVATVWTEGPPPGGSTSRSVTVDRLDESLLLTACAHRAGVQGGTGWVLRVEPGATYSIKQVRPAPVVTQSWTYDRFAIAFYRDVPPCAGMAPIAIGDDDGVVPDEATWAIITTHTTVTASAGVRWTGRNLPFPPYLWFPLLLPGAGATLAAEPPTEFEFTSPAP
jgi:hypothetical protein